MKPSRKIQRVVRYESEPSPPPKKVLPGELKGCGCGATKDKKEKTKKEK